MITYRAPSAIRDSARALGYSPGQQDAFAKAADRWNSVAATAGQDGHGIPRDVLGLAARLEGFPRHLGIHSGGMVLSRTPVSEVVPVEWARMQGRSILQWDKDDCAAAGLVKIDLLGLGMLSALHYMLDLIAEHHDTVIDLGQIDLADPKVYDMLCAADAIGVFQVESRAQLGTLPRLRPRTFYDLVVEVALIRPGPIQGGSVHPYLRRRRGEEAWSHAHPLLAGPLDRTLGVPLFQEQVMQMATSVGSFTAAEADQLRRAMGAKRSAAKMERLRDRFYAGAAANGVTGELADTIYEQIKAFSGYGFPEAHAMSFALLVYASAFIKCYYPAAFTAGLLRAQPMGFYSPQSLVADARHHGVKIRRADINRSLAHPTLESDPDSIGGVAIRLGLGGIRHLGDDPVTRLITERDQHGPFTDLGDLGYRTDLTAPAMQALATSGALESLGPDRRQALWAAGPAAASRDTHLPGIASGLDAPALPGMTAFEITAADLWATGISPDEHPMQYLREYLDGRGALTTAAVTRAGNGATIWVAGAVTHRQRPATAGGITFLNLEDETGMLNIVVNQRLWDRERKTVRSSPALLVHGVVQSHHGVTSLSADHFEPLDLRGLAGASRDFR